jgi:hypothetical protein
MQRSQITDTGNTTKQIRAPRKPFSAAREAGRKLARDSVPLRLFERGSVMWTLINMLYQEYCRARLAEMRHVRR